MNKNFMLIVAAIIIVVILGVWYINNKDISGSSSLNLIAQVNYICDGNKTIQAAFYEGKYIPAKEGQPPIPTGSVKIILSDGRNFNLPQTISASGIRYANSDESFIFWSKGDNAFIIENGKETYSGCVASL